jgi:acetyl esterase
MTTAPQLHPALDPGLAALLGAIAAAGLPRIGAGTPVEARAGFRALTCDIRSPELVVPVGSVTEGTLPGPAGPLAYRVYRPADVTGPVPTVLFIHGGGFVIGDIDTHDNQARRVCRDTGAVVVSVDYRLAPEAAFPAPVDDCWAALRWVAEHGSRCAATAPAATCPPSSPAGRGTRAGPHLSRSCCCTPRSTPPPRSPTTRRASTTPTATCCGSRT